MHQYYRQSVNPPPAHLRRRSRLTRTRPVTYPPPVRNQTRPTIPLSLSSGNSQNTEFSKSLFEWREVADKEEKGDPSRNSTSKEQERDEYEKHDGEASLFLRPDG